MHALTGKTYGLQPANGHASQASVRVVTRERTPAVPVVELVKCTGDLTCDCPACSEERAKAINAGSRDKRQPWERAA